MNIRTDLPLLTKRIASLPVSDRGYPVPYFVRWIDGKPDFRVFDRAKFNTCVNRNLCYVCGQRLGRYKCFPIGPMCSVNRNTAEPPSHLDCCEWSVKACPFMVRPNMERREDERSARFKSAGVAIKRNPGVICLWTVTKFEIVQVSNGILFRLPNPYAVTWYREGRLATRSEVEESVDSGLPLLRETCENDQDRNDLEALVRTAKYYYPL